MYSCETMTGLDRHLQGAMAQAWPLLRRMVLVMAGMLGMDEDSAPERVSRGVRIAVLRILRPAEALTRRLIVLMAREMDVTEALNKRCRSAARSGGETMGSALSPIHRKAQPCGDQPKNHFILFEPLRIPRSIFADTALPARPKPKGAGPRILSFDRPFPVTPAPAPDVSASSLTGRIRALEKALAAPEKIARRHAIFLERDRRSNQLPGRINPIRPGPAPGMRSHHTPPDLKELLLFIGIEAQRGPPRPTPARLTLS